MHLFSNKFLELIPRQEWGAEINLAAVRCFPSSKAKTNSISFLFLFLFFLLLAAFQNSKWVWELTFGWRMLEVFPSVWMLTHRPGLLGQIQCYERAPFFPHLLFWCSWFDPNTLFSSLKISNCTFQETDLHVNYRGGGGGSLWSSQVRPGDIKEASQEKKK